MPKDIFPPNQQWRLKRPKELLRLDPEFKRLVILLLEYYEKSALRAAVRMTLIPKHERPDWFENSRRYWNHAVRTIRWVKKLVSAIGVPYGTAARYRPEATDTTLSIGSDEGTSRYRGKLRDWFEPL